MGEVVDWSCSAAVELDDHALAMVARMAAALIGTAAIMRRTESSETRQRGLEVYDDLSPHGDLLSEHVEVLEKYAEEILDSLMEDQEGYFSHESKLQKFTVMSIVKRRCRTIRVQRFFVTKNGHRAIQDNDRLSLECHDGALACSWGGSVVKNDVKRLKKARA